MNFVFLNLRAITTHTQTHTCTGPPNSLFLGISSFIKQALYLQSYPWPSFTSPLKSLGQSARHTQKSGHFSTPALWPLRCDLTLSATKSLLTGVLVSIMSPSDLFLNTAARVILLKARLVPVTLLHRNFRDFLSHPVQSPYKDCKASHFLTSSHDSFLLKCSAPATLLQTCFCLRLCLIPLLRNSWK